MRIPFPAKSMRSLEQEILSEVKAVLHNRQFRLKDLAEWSTSERVIDSGLMPDEVKVHLPETEVWCAVPKKHDKRKTA